jgi:cephalosporin-C deacetylase-like acetyl esterase
MKKDFKELWKKKVPREKKKKLKYVFIRLNLHQAID